MKELKVRLHGRIIVFLAGPISDENGKNINLDNSLNTIANFKSFSWEEVRWHVKKGKTLNIS
ncbi:hypothetical protein [Proteus sp. STS61-E]|uniref:hypothetical protein n=1 Tax=Proteus sp. STS61-E TaxID=3237301 RepID=UPI0034C6A8E8